MKITFDSEEERTRFCNFLTKLYAISEFAPITNSSSQHSIKPQYEAFELLWQQWPNKKGKKPAQAKFERLSNAKKKALWDRCQYLKKTEWSGKESQFIPMLQTFINQERWNDDIEIPKPTIPIGDNNRPVDPRRYPVFKPEPEVEKASKETVTQSLDEIKKLFNPRSV